MDNFLNVIISGMAVAFLLSSSSALLEPLVSIRIYRLVATWPMGIVAVVLMGTEDLFQVAVMSMAAGFFGLSILRVVETATEKPTIVDRRRV